MRARSFRLASWLSFLILAAACGGSDPQNTVFVVRGDGRALGARVGTQFGEEIRRVINDWLMPKLNLFPGIVDIFLRQKTGSMHFADEFIAEGEAIASAARVDSHRVFQATASPDLMTLAGSPFGCSSLAVLPQRSANGGMLIGHNLDFPASSLLRRYWRAILFAKTGALKILSIQIPGMIGVVNAINEKGVSVLVHMVNASDTNSANTPVLVNAREALEQGRSAREAMQIYVRNAPTVPMNVLFADGKEALVLESTASRNETRLPTRSNVLYVANHFVTSKMSQYGPGPDERWPILEAADRRPGNLGMSEVVDVIGRAGGFNAAGGESNVLAFFVDYGRRKLTWGSDPGGEDRSAFGPLYEIDIDEAFKD